MLKSTRTITHKVPASRQKFWQKVRNFKSDILILGAGMAGVAAAETLKKLGVKNLLVLEGSDRWGEPEGSTVSWLWKSDWKSFRNIPRQEHQLLFNPDIIWTFKGMQPALLFSFHPWKTCWRQLHTKPEETLVLFLVFVFFASKNVFLFCQTCV